MAKKTKGQKDFCMVGGSLIERLTEVSNRQILLKIAALWGAVFFETKKTVNTQAPRAQSVKNPGGLLARLAL